MVPTSIQVDGISWASTICSVLLPIAKGKKPEPVIYSPFLIKEEKQQQERHTIVSDYHNWYQHSFEWLPHPSPFHSAKGEE